MAGNDRITVLLRDGNGGSAIGTGELPAAALDAGPVYVSIPQWPGASDFFVIELRREAEPATVQGTAADWDAPLPALDGGPAVPQVPVIRPEHPELAADLAPTEKDPDVVTFSVHCPDGSTIILRDSATAGHVNAGTPIRTLGEISTELAERLGLSKRARADDPADNWTLADPTTGAAYDPARCLTPAADGRTFALVRTPLSVQTGQ